MFQIMPDQAHSQDWRTYRFAAVGMDLGSDGCPALHALQFLFDCALEAVPDGAHGANRSMVCALKTTGLYPLILLWIISCNLLHGPGREDYRCAQLRDHMQELLKQPTPVDVPLFQALAPRIIAAFEDSGADFVSGVSEELQAWRMLPERQAFLKEGPRATMCRFAGTLRANLPFWAIQQFERTHVALEEHFVSNASFVKHLRLKPTSAHEPGEGCGRLLCRIAFSPGAILLPTGQKRSRLGIGSERQALPDERQPHTEGGGSTSASRITIEDKAALRSCTQTCVALSVAVLSDGNNDRLLRIVERCGRPVLEWDTAQRSSAKCSSCQKFMMEQASGEFIQHVCRIASATTDVASLDSMHFVTTFAPSSLLAGQRREVIAEDDMADVLGQFQWSVVVERIKRGLWMTLGWPWGMSKALAGTDAANPSSASSATRPPTSSCAITRTSGRLANPC